MRADLPQSWLRVLLNDVGEIVTGKTPSTKNPDNFGGSIPFIKPADLDNGGYVTRTADTLSDAGAKLVPTIPQNSIPVTCIGNLGKVGIASQSSATNQQINTVVPSSQVDYLFVYYQLQTLKPWMQENASATTVTIINKGKFSKAPVALPPLAEQKVIADKLDTLLAQVENTKARLERIPQILKGFRQSVLAAAVSGRLAEEWSSTDVELREIAQFQNGYAFKSGWFENSGAYQVVKLGNIRDGYIALENSPAYVSDEIANEFSRYAPNPGDILISMTGTRFKKDYGLGCMIKDEKNLLINQRVGRVIPDRSKVRPEFLALFVRSDCFRDQFFDGETGGVNQGNVGSKHILSILIELPTIDVQKEIIRRVDQLLAHADRIEKRANNALDRVNNLTQSILAKAFRGELTEQWRKDNPKLISGENSAKALLERIKTERAKQQTAKSRTKTRKTETPAT